jgi:hypothetical protein
MYEITKSVDWDNWDYVYFENGYIALMKICNMIGLSARGFFFVVYTIMLYPIYRLIKNYSINPCLSILFFICYQFLQFDLTGLRQAIGMSICAIAYMCALKSGLRYLFIYLLCVFCAYNVHSSALIFLPVYWIIRLPFNRKMIIMYISIACVCVVLNVVGVAAIFEYFDKNKGWSNADSQQLGLSLVFIIGVAAMAVYSFYSKKANAENKLLKGSFAHLLLVSVCSMCLFNGSELLRASMYYYLIGLISVPYFFKNLSGGFDKFGSSAFAVFLIIFFLFIDNLNAFDLLPYTIADNPFQLFR